MLNINSYLQEGVLGNNHYHHLKVEVAAMIFLIVTEVSVQDLVMDQFDYLVH